MICTLVKIEDINKQVKTFWFKPLGQFRYSPGQFTEIRLPHDNQDERGDKRWFTLSSSPSEEYISFTTRFVTPPEQSSTFKEALKSLKPGFEVNLAEAMGDFVLPKDKNQSLLFIAGGMGITPYRSILKSLIDSGEKRQIQMIYAVRNPEDFIFLDIIKKFGIKIELIVSNPNISWKGHTGKLSGKRIKKFPESLDNKLIYMSGPESMVEILEKELLELGVESNNLVLDFFPGYKPV